MVYRVILVAGLVGALANVPAPRAQVAPAGQSSAQGQRPPLPLEPPDFFRKLIEMSAAEREQTLAARPEKAREVLRAGLKEYDALSPEERETRLRILDLKWYLVRLMKVAPTNRAESLRAVPDRVRKLVERRLESWDQLPPDVQADVLACEPAVGMFLRPENGTISASAHLSVITPKQRERMEQAVKYLNGLPDEQRQKVFKGFAEILEVSDREQARALERLGAVERQEMERTLEMFDNLPAGDRERCISGFQKFSALSLQERDEFLRSAERWQSMNARDRQVWRSLVIRKVLPQPPLPPGASTPKAQIPTRNTLLATNEN